MFRIIKLAAWATLGWAAYRSLSQLSESTEEASPDGARDDGDANVVTVTATVKAEDDLRRVRGIGPAIESLLKDNGITTWSRLAASEVADLQAILDEAGPRYRTHDPSTWPAQAAELASAN